MKVKIKLVPMPTWKEARAKMPSEPLYDIPATIPGIMFKGFYSDLSRNEILVAWPVDRPQEAQEEFAKKICLGGWPVQEMERKVNRQGLSVINTKGDT